MTNKDAFPTIEQSLKMIEEKLKTQKEKKGKNKDTNLLKKNRSELPSLSDLFRRNKRKEMIKQEKKDDVFLLTKKVVDKDKIINLKEIKVKPKENNKKKQDKEIDLNIKDYKNLKKTTDLAVIIKKLKNIRDKILNKKKNSKEINKEIGKLNETIDLAEDLFKKELLDL